MTGVGLLEGVRVLDLSIFLSGPFATQLLGDLGAEVIKVEPPGGDHTRVLPPNFIGEDSAYYLSCNRNKRSAVIDYRTPEGAALIEQLATKCDVFFENLRPGAMAKSGLSYERLRQINPRLVYCSLSGFGQDGPYRTRPAYDMVIQALSGGMSLTGERDGRPVRAGIPLADLAAGQYAVMGILAALHHRNRTGEGRFIDIGMLDCQVAMLSYQAAYYLASGKVPGPQGREHESVPSYRAFTARDGRDVVVTANTDRMWRSLCEAVERIDLRDDPRMATRAQRYYVRDEIWAALEAAFLKRDAADWVRVLHAHEVPVAEVNTLDRVMADPQVLHREMNLELRDEARGLSARVAGNPFKVPESGAQQHRYPPLLGEDTERVLSDILGLPPGQVRALMDRKVVAGHEPRGRPAAASQGGGA
ncbi:CaiB/BaiF CoA transferase family protein [Ramlibacter sp.]|uniref:CaiB/BaiF CoA transferase family protein n=1 Tax=Ramlibacter sp. TaxID=1917967 RepID=UPI003D1442A8